MSSLLGASSGGLVIFYIIYFAVLVFEIAAIWMVFAKAGRPGWGAIIPFYNMYLLCKVGQRPGWWWILFCIPLVNIVISLIVALGVAKAFTKGTGFAIGLWLLSFIFFPILGFGPATYAAAPPA